MQTTNNEETKTMHTTSNITVSESAHTSLTIEFKTRHPRLADIIRRSRRTLDCTVDYQHDAIAGYLVPSVEHLLEGACELTREYPWQGSSPADVEDWCTAMKLVVNATGCALRNLGAEQVERLTSDSGLGHKLWQFDCHLELGLIESRRPACGSFGDLWTQVLALQEELYSCGVRVSFLKP